MKKFILAAGVATVVSMGSFAVPTIAQAQPAIIVQTAPPPPRFERVPAPRRGYVWAPGHWEWRGNRHAWQPGVWVKARAGYAYRQPEWRQNDGRWEMRRGGWDRDGDGVPNRADRRPGNPYRN